MFLRKATLCVFLILQVMALPCRGEAMRKKSVPKLEVELNHLIEATKSPEARSSSPKTSPTPTPTPAPALYHQLSVGTFLPLFGFGPLQPEVRYQVSGGGNIALGIGVHFLKGYKGKAAMGISGFTLGVDYYSMEPFGGWWAHFGMGMAGVHAKTNTLGVNWNFRFKSPEFIMTAGYRFQYKNGWNLGVSGGFLYLDRWGLVPGSEFGGFTPVITLDIGYKFNF